MSETSKNQDLRKIKKINKNGEITEITVDWNKLPCAKCSFRFHFGCPNDCWDKEGKYCVY